MEKKEIILDELASVSGGASGAKTVTIINCEHFVHVRKSASAQSDIVGSAYANATYPFFGWSGNWAKVKVGNFIGYVYKDFIRVN